MGAFFPGNALFQFQVYREYSRRCFSVFVRFVIMVFIPVSPGRDRKALGTRIPQNRGKKRGGLAARSQGPFRVREEEGSA